MRTRSIAGARVTSRPSNSMRPACGSRLPVIRLKRVDLPAPFGPITPKASPRDTAKVTESETFKAPNDFETLSRRRITVAIPVCAELGRRRSTPLRPQARGSILPAAGISGAVAFSTITSSKPPPAFFRPWPPDERRLADVLRCERRHAGAVPGDLADHGHRVGGGNRCSDRIGIGRIRNAAHDIRRHFKQRMREAYRLGPRTASLRREIGGELRRGLTGQRRLERMRGGPPDLRRKVVAGVAERRG